MKKEFKDFLFRFTDEENADFKIKSTERDLLNNILREVSTQELAMYASQLNNRWLLGFTFWDACFDFVEEKNKVKFLEIVWIMFSSEKDKEDWHPWDGQFDPLYGEKRDSKKAKWFREGVVRFELDETLLPLQYTFNYGWWNNIEHLLGDLCKFRKKDFLINFLINLAKKINKVEQLSLSLEMDKFEILETFKFWAGKELSNLDTQETNWYSNKV